MNVFVMFEENFIISSKPLKKQNVTDRFYTILWNSQCHTQNCIIPNINPMFYIIFPLKYWTS